MIEFYLTKVKQRFYNQYTTRKKFRTAFPVLKFNIRYVNFLGSQQYLRNYISIREKVVLGLFFQNKFDNASSDIWGLLVHLRPG